MKIADIARITHDANRALCASHGDTSQPSWDDAPDWQRNSALAGVRLHVSRDATPEESHEGWLAIKVAEGWQWGPVKDPDAKLHPCMIPYDELPPEQRAKDHLFRGIVHALRVFVDHEEA